MVLKNTSSNNTDIQGSDDENNKAFYMNAITLPQNSNLNRVPLKASPGYVWCYILSSLVDCGSVSDFDNATDDALAYYRDLYDRSSDPEWDLALSILRFLKAFNTTSINIPNLESLVFKDASGIWMSNQLSGVELDRLLNTEFAFEVSPTTPVTPTTIVIPNTPPTTVIPSTQLWKFIYFIYRVYRGPIITDNLFFSIFDSFRPPISSRVSVPSQNRNLAAVAASTNIAIPSNAVMRTYAMQIIVPNTSSSDFTSLEGITSALNNVKPTNDLNISTATGVYMTRVCKITGISSAGTPSFTTTLKLNIVIDAFRLRSPVIDASGQPLLPYQIVSLGTMQGGTNRTDNIVIDFNNVAGDNCISSFEDSATGTLYHIAYESDSDKSIVYRISNFNKVFIKNGVLAVECTVNDLSGSPSSIITPTIAQSRLVGQAVGTEISDIMFACKDPQMSITMTVANQRI